MFAPVFHDDDEGHHNGVHQQQHHHHNLHHNNNNNNNNGQFIFARTAMVFKINNILLLLSLGVAAFVQCSTLEPRYLNALLWGTQEVVFLQDDHPSYTNDNDNNSISTMSSSNLLLMMRSLQSLLAIFLLCFLRTVMFPRASRQHDTVLEAVLGDMLFHIQCRLWMGFVIATCCCCCRSGGGRFGSGGVGMNLPFDTMETILVCGSIILQQLWMT